MPTLLIEHAEQTRGIVLDGRLLIGRAAPGGIVISDSAVSRIHAWIDRTPSGFYIADADSRTGTLCGEQPLTTRHELTEGDIIRVGPARLIYRETSTLPEGIEELPTAHSHDAAIAAAGGILFACTCGAPLWAPIKWVGRRGKCAKCGQRTPVPPLPNSAITRPAPVPQPHKERQTCSICQWSIAADDDHTRCPTCGLTFHSECWQENKGCSAYGCASVNALLDPNEKDEPEVAADQAESSGAESAIAADSPEPFPVEFALLGGSVIGSLIGLIAFGVPALLVAVYAIYFAVTGSRSGKVIRTGLIAAAVGISVCGCVGGVWFSAVKWLHRPLTAPWHHA